jgi:hypothetical protein
MARVLRGFDTKLRREIGSQPVRTFVQLEYNLKDDPLSPEWVVRFNFAPLFVLGGD